MGTREQDYAVVASVDLVALVESCCMGVDAGVGGVEGTTPQRRHEELAMRVASALTAVARSGVRLMVMVWREVGGWALAGPCDLLSEVVSNNNRLTTSDQTSKRSFCQIFREFSY